MCATTNESKKKDLSKNHPRESKMSFCDYSKMNFRVIVSKNITRNIDAKIKYDKKAMMSRSTSPKKAVEERRYNIVLDIVLTAQPIAKDTKLPITPVTPPPTRESSPTPDKNLINRSITIYDTDYTVVIPKDFDIYEGLRMYYPDLYTLAIKEDRELSDISRLDEYDNEDEFEERMSRMDYLEWIHD